MESILTEAMQSATVMNCLLLSFIFIIADLASGFLKAFYNKNFKSSIAKKGLVGKAEWILILMVGYSVELLLHFSPVIYAMCICCVITEFSSILENAHACGIDLDIMAYLQDYIPAASKKEKAKDEE